MWNEVRDCSCECIEEAVHMPPFWAGFEILHGLGRCPREGYHNIGVGLEVLIGEYNHGMTWTDQDQ